MEADIQAHSVIGQPRASSARQVRWLGTTAACGVLYFFAAVAVLHFLRPDYDPISRVASNYAVGPYGWLMTIAFFAFAWSLFALALGFYLSQVPTRRYLTASVLLGIAGLGLVGSGIFPTDVTTDDSPSTPVGFIHIFSGVISFICIVAAALLLSRRFKQDKWWQPFYAPAFSLALASLAGFAAFFVIKAMQLPIGGLGERVFLGLVLLWIFVTAIGMARAVEHSSAAAVRES